MPDLSHTIAFKAVKGAVRNALHGHPEWKVPRDFDRSVAKRAAGTLMAHAGPSLLASARRSGQRQRQLNPASGSVVTVSKKRKTLLGGAVPLKEDGRPLSLIRDDLSRAATVAHKAGDEKLFWALVTAARLIKAEIR